LTKIDWFEYCPVVVDTRISQVRQLTKSTFVLRFDRNEIDFEPGQHLHLGLPGSLDMREYSVYSGLEDNFLEALIKEVDDGVVSRQLHKLETGDGLQVNGPFGFFLLKNDCLSKKHYLVATGTGIAPYRCFIRSVPDLDYAVLHGIRNPDERYEHEVFDPSRYVACVSGGINASSQNGELWFKGRVTAYLRHHGVDPDGLYYLCGNCDMIYEVYDILKGGGVSTKNIFAEVYF
jgi:ferredoxin--NADP+ reductase/benzoate/toluate 1,2-dioxygenase reductase subunit